MAMIWNCTLTLALFLMMISESFFQPVFSSVSTVASPASASTSSIYTQRENWSTDHTILPEIRTRTVHDKSVAFTCFGTECHTVEERSSPDLWKNGIVCGPTISLGVNGWSRCKGRRSHRWSRWKCWLKEWFWNHHQKQSLSYSTVPHHGHGLGAVRADRADPR